ncbi:MAG: UDP-N-acetylglucosamine/UDP-N-acetylgalactosamine diphosphorylase [Verrucomicrobiales bacterium]
MPDADLRLQFEQANHGHVYRFFDELSEAEQEKFEDQLRQISLDEIKELTSQPEQVSGAVNLEGIEPASYRPLPESGGDPDDWAEATKTGEAALRAGRVAAFTVAGGQGTRLDWHKPKGTFPVTPIREASLFQVFAEKILAASRRYEKPVPWFIMTSLINHEETIAHFDEHDFFGLDRKLVRFFSQGQMPAVDEEGRIMMAGKGEIAFNPDGHGGSLRALVRNDCTKMMRELGVECVSYFQVDNPLIRCVDPAFIGFHLREKSELSCKACPKANAEEKVGVFVRDPDNNLGVIEYSELGKHAFDIDQTGSLKFRAGSIAIHIFSVDLIENLGFGQDSAKRLPFHRAHKKVTTIDAAGNPHKPTKANGIKFEMFVFDALKFARNPVVIETARQDDFSPVKNFEGVDSPATCRVDQLKQFASWAAAAGQQLPVDENGVPAAIEVSPLFACDEAEFVRKVREQGLELKPGMILT